MRALRKMVCLGLCLTNIDFNTVRILIATDTQYVVYCTSSHSLGYLERDPVRGQDSLNTFKEILQLAKDRNVSVFCFGLL